MGSKGPKYNQNQAMDSQIKTAQAQAKYGTYGVNSIFGNMGLQQNADGTYTLNYENSNADRQRQNLVNQGLAGLSLDPTKAQNAYYAQATRQLLPQFQRNEDRLHEQLVNRGITAGSSLYNEQMENLRNQQNGTLADISNQAVFSGQDYLGSQIGNIGALANQFDALKVGSLGGQTGAGFQDTYNQKFNADQQRAQAKNAMWGTIGSLAGSAIGLFSDARLKENIVPVGKLDNGLTVYLFNFKGDNKKQIGLIAQEVKEVIPEAVSEKDGYLTVNYELATKGGK